MVLLLRRCVQMRRIVPQESQTGQLTRNHSGIGSGHVCTSRTYAVGRICELASDLVHQIFMLSARAISLDDVSGAVVGVGLGGGITNTDNHLWMERTDRCGTRRKQRITHERL